jgi:hypothetical protein
MLEEACANVAHGYWEFPGQGDPQTVELEGYLP